MSLTSYSMYDNIKSISSISSEDLQVICLQNMTSLQQLRIEGIHGVSTKTFYLRGGRKRQIHSLDGFLLIFFFIFYFFIPHSQSPYARYQRQWQWQTCGGIAEAKTLGSGVSGTSLSKILTVEPQS